MDLSRSSRSHSRRSPSAMRGLLIVPPADFDGLCGGLDGVRGSFGLAQRHGTATVESSAKRQRPLFGH